jgi:hypothetical protein
MSLSLPALLALLTPPIAAIAILRPSWPEYLLLISPFIAAIGIALFAFRLASFIALGVIGLLVMLCAFSMDVEDRGVISSSVSAFLLPRILGVHERENLLERYRRQNRQPSRRRRFLLAQAVGVEFVMLSLITWFLPE